MLPPHNVITEEHMFAVATSGPPDEQAFLNIADHLYQSRCQNKGRMIVLFRKPGERQTLGDDPAHLPEVRPRDIRRLSWSEQYSVAMAIATIDSDTGERAIAFGIFN